MHIDGENGGAEGEADDTDTKTNGGAKGAAEGKDTVSLASDEDEIVLGDDEEDDEDDKDDAEGEEGEEEAGEKPRKPSRSARYKARIAKLEAALEEERRSKRSPTTRAPDSDDDLVEPKETDFPDDYLAYERALRKYETRLAIREENRRVAKSEAEANASAEHRERQAAYNARLETVKGRIADFDAVMRDAGRVEIRDDVRDAILESAKGPLLAYYLAKNPDVLDELNAMPPAAAARKLGNLEARIRGPKPKTATNAKPPKPAPKGGGGPAKALDPEKLSPEEYRKARAEGRIK